jgi:ribosome-associated toxin RatA of RatAB toxin-antitoxin module
MADQATQKMVIGASPEQIVDVLLDFEAYSRWARDIKGVIVEERDDEGRGKVVTFRAAAMGRSTSYTLRYGYDLPNRISWELVRGDIMRRLDGAYELEPVDDGGTHVTYHLEVEVIVPLPGFVKRRAEAKIMHTALRELRAHVQP